MYVWVRDNPQFGSLEGKVSYELSRFKIFKSLKRVRERERAKLHSTDKPLNNFCNYDSRSRYYYNVNWKQTTKLQNSYKENKNNHPHNSSQYSSTPTKHISFQYLSFTTPPHINNESEIILKWFIFNYFSIKCKQIIFINTASHGAFSWKKNFYFCLFCL